MKNLFALSQIVEINHEPRIRDVDLAERLGYAMPTNIKVLIARNREELEGFGILHHGDVNSKSGKGRPGTGYWLNEGQALVLCSLSRTPVAAQIRKALIETFQAYRTGKIVHVNEHYRKPPVRLRKTGIDQMSEDQQRAFVQAFLGRPEGLETLLTMCLVQIGELRASHV